MESLKNLAERILLIQRDVHDFLGVQQWMLERMGSGAAAGPSKALQRECMRHLRVIDAWLREQAHVSTMRLSKTTPDSANLLDPHSQPGVSWKRGEVARGREAGVVTAASIGRRAQPVQPLQSELSGPLWLEWVDRVDEKRCVSSSINGLLCETSLMHVSGKILAGLLVAALLGAIFMTAKSFAIRDAWMKQAQDNEKAIKENDEKIAILTRTLQEKRADYARTMIGWDREWVSPGAVTENDKVGLQIGTGQGLQKELGQVLYVFVPNADGTSVYLGDFKVDSVNDAGARGSANSRRRAADLKQAQYQNVRVRTMIPEQYLKRLGDLDQSLLSAELAIRSNNEELARQGRLSEQADKLIAARLAEMNGNPDLANQQIPEVHIKGLLTSIVSEEEARNAALIEADQLMRELKKTRDEFQAIRKENLQRVEALPKSAANQSASR